MSAAQSSSNTAKGNAEVKKDDEGSKDVQKPAVSLEEDDEFEDFPVEDWPAEEAEGPANNNSHLWEESWDDDDTTEDFSKQLKEELKKVDGNKGGNS